MRRRTAVVGGTLLATAVLAAAAGAVWARSEHHAERSAPNRDDVASTTTTTTGPRTTTATAKPQPVATLDLAVGDLPDRGIGVIDVRANQVVLLDDDDRVVARGAGDFGGIVAGEEIVAAVDGAKVQLRAVEPEHEARHDGCLPGRTSGEVTVELCGDEHLPNRIDLVAPGGRTTLLGLPPPPGADATIGHWVSAELSPDGRTVLAQFSAECEVQFTFFIDVASRTLTATTGEDVQHWNRAPSSMTAGWRPDGQAVISLGPSACGNSSESGVYLATPWKKPKLFHRTGTDLPPGIFTWRNVGPGPCDLPVTATSAALPAGWEPSPRLGPSSGHPTVGAIAHWVGPGNAAITAVGRDGAGLVEPATPGTEPLAVFTSMGNPAFLLSNQGLVAAQVDPPNAPTECSPVFLIGEGISAEALQTFAESLQPRDPPPHVDIAVSGNAVRGAQVSIRATGPTWPEDLIDIELANPDGFGANSYATAKHERDGSIIATFVVPTAFSYDGLCRSSGNCDRLSSSRGPMRARFTVGRGAPRRIVGEGTFEVVAAEPGVAYPTTLNDECGPPRIDFDGTTWVASQPTARSKGEITVRSRTRATFRSQAGATVALRPSPTGFSC